MPIVTEDDFENLYGTKFLSGGDVKKPTVVTVKDVSTETFAKQGEVPRTKMVLLFNEVKKGLVLNKTNATALAAILKSKKPIDWIGHKILLQAEIVSFAGKVSEAVRIYPVPRAPTEYVPRAPIAYPPAQDGADRFSEIPPHDHLPESGEPLDMVE